MKQFLIGLKTPWTGLDMLMKYRSLRIRLIIPYLIIFLIFGLLLYFFAAQGVGWIHQLTDYLLEKVSLDVDQIQTMRWYQKTLFYPLFYLLKALFYLVSLALMMLATLLLGNLLCAFFWELIIEKVFLIESKQAWVFEHDNLVKKILIPLGREVVKEVLYVMLFIAVWFVTIVPFVGPMISLVLGPIAICFWFGFIVCDFSMSVMAADVKKRFAYSKLHWTYLTGLGLYALIPFLGLIIYPLLVTGHAKNMASHDVLAPPKDFYLPF